MKKKYTIEFNEDRDYMLSAVLHFLVEMNGAEFAKFMTDHGVSEEFMSFLEEKAEKNHEFGWCKDPNCERKNGK